MRQIGSPSPSTVDPYLWLTSTMGPTDGPHPPVTSSLSAPKNTLRDGRNPPQATTCWPRLEWTG
uniref:Uncharacterized protein n=1 Tax=Rhizophora mucronata TaxID=61149 RepID=A0A2P2LT75_RHIMU